MQLSFLMVVRAKVLNKGDGHTPQALALTGKE
jgi:hypothetical protein